MKIKIPSVTPGVRNLLVAKTDSIQGSRFQERKDKSMIVKTWRVHVAVSVALAVLVAYSVPVRALSVTKSAATGPASTAIPLGEDDEDGPLSGSLALAVLLLAVGGAVAGVL